MRRLALALVAGASGAILGALAAHWWDDTDGRVRRVAEDAERARAELRQWKETMAAIDRVATIDAPPGRPE